MPEKFETATRPLISLTDVVKTYDTGEVPFTALKGVNLDVGDRASSSGSSASRARARRRSST